MSRTIVSLFVVVAVSALGCNLGGGGSQPQPAVTTPPPVASGGGVLAVGTPSNGTFGPGLPLDESQKPYIDFTFTAPAAGRYQFDLVSSNTGVYDPYLRLMQGPSEIAHDDDGGTDPLQSRLAQDLQPGSYTVRVTRFGGGQITEAVAFTLTAAQVPAAPVAPSAVPPAAGGGTTLTIGVPAAGTFTPALPTDETGKPYIDYQLTVAAAGTYRIDLASADTSTYDPYVRVLQGTTEVGADDDSGDVALQSRLTQQLAPGTYTVRVTKFGTGAVSAAVPFTLTVTQAS